MSGNKGRAINLSRASSSSSHNTVVQERSCFRMEVGLPNYAVLPDCHGHATVCGNLSLTTLQF